jgi:hypothetical protein
MQAAWLVSVDYRPPGRGRFIYIKVLCACAFVRSLKKVFKFPKNIMESWYV